MHRTNDGALFLVLDIFISMTVWMQAIARTSEAQYSWRRYHHMVLKVINVVGFVVLVSLCFLKRNIFTCYSVERSAF